jgi:UPF0755 protein
MSWHQSSLRILWTAFYHIWQETGALAIVKDERIRYNTYMDTKQHLQDLEKKIEQKIEDEQGKVHDDLVKTGKKKLLVMSVVGGLFFIVAAVFAGYYAPNPLLAHRSGYIHVKDAMTASEVAQTLYDKGVISSTTWFRAVAMVTGDASQIKQGEYVVDTSMSVHDLLEKLISGKSEATRLVIPEGYTVRKIAQTLDTDTGISEADFLAAAKDTSLLYPYMKGNRDVTFPTEGFLFPDTYFITKDMTAEDVVKIMLKNFDEHLTQPMKEGIAARNMSIYQFVTLASIVEKEAKYEEDRPRIASVFLNRLQKHMKLQSDASISYAMGSHKAAYSISETQYDSPYNTYMYEGLPPGPIGNPGMDCMNAILDAPQTNYLYFVADAKGHNYFAVTYEEHMKNVQEHMP